MIFSALHPLIKVNNKRIYFLRLLSFSLLMKIEPLKQHIRHVMLLHSGYDDTEIAKNIKLNAKEIVSDWMCRK